MAEPSVPLTAAQIDILTKDWPVGAKPKDVYFDPHGQPYMLCVCPRQHCAIHPSDAAALFRDSGLRWLHRQGVPIITGQSAADLFWAATTKQGERWEGADLLICISQAVAAIKRERGEHE